MFPDVFGHISSEFSPGDDDETPGLYASLILSD